MSLELRTAGDAVLLRVAARPGASRSAIQGTHAGALKVAIQAPPEKGKANKQLVAFLAKALGLKRYQDEISEAIFSTIMEWQGVKAIESKK